MDNTSTNYKSKRSSKSNDEDNDVEDSIDDVVTTNTSEQEKKTNVEDNNVKQQQLQQGKTNSKDEKEDDHDDDDILSGPQHVEDTSGELAFSSFYHCDVKTVPSGDNNLTRQDCDDDDIRASEENIQGTKLSAKKTMTQKPPMKQSDRSGNSRKDEEESKLQEGGYKLRHPKDISKKMKQEKKIVLKQQQQQAKTKSKQEKEDDHFQQQTKYRRDYGPKHDDDEFDEDKKSKVKNHRESGPRHVEDDDDYYDDELPISTTAMCQKPKNYDSSCIQGRRRFLRESGPRHVDDDSDDDAEDEKTLSRQKQAAAHHGCNDQKDSVVHRRKNSGPRHVTDDDGDDDENETIEEGGLNKRQALSTCRQPTTTHDGRTAVSIDDLQKKRTIDRGPRYVLDDYYYNRNSSEYYVLDADEDYNEYEETVIVENNNNNNENNSQPQEQHQQYPVDDNISPQEGEDVDMLSSDFVRPGAVYVPGPLAEDNDQTTYRQNHQRPSRHFFQSIFQNLSIRTSGTRDDHDQNLAIAAEVVAPDEEDIEARVQRRILMEAVTPELVERVESPHEKRIKRAMFTIFAIAAIATIIGLAVGLPNRKDDDTEEVTLSPTATPAPTLQLVSEAGVLKCGDFGSDGIENDLCHAVAAAVFGPQGRFEVINLTSPAERFEALANGTIHLADDTTPTMERDLCQKQTEVGFSFTTPYYYDGLTFGGISEYVRCADILDTFGNCSDLKICIDKETTFFDFLHLRLPASALVINSTNIYQGIIKQKCNVIAAIGLEASELVVRSAGYLGNYTVGKSVYLKDPLTLVTRDDDPEWSDFVNAVLRSLFAAEMMGITQKKASKFTTTSVFGEEYETMFIDAITDVGNYGEIYDRNKEIFFPRNENDINSLNTNGSTGLIYSLPFGDIQRIGSVSSPEGTLERIRKRGKILCGVRLGRPGFAWNDTTTNMYSGLDVDYCRTLASSIFDSNRNAVEFVPYDYDSSDVGDIFVSLANETIDVAAGIGITLERDVREPTTGEGFAFSEPYFYDPPEGILENTSSLVTRQDDPQWSAYVYWIVIATFYAEENDLTHDLSFRMPLVSILGPSFSRMLRDAILVGNYGELYERNVEKFVPRSGRNMLNQDPFGPQINPYFVWDG